MNRIIRTLALVGLSLLLVPASALAGSLYVPAPAPAGPGHPLQLGPDHRASQIGDLVYVVYDFSVSSNSSNIVNNSKTASLGYPGATGNLALAFLRIPTSIGGSSQVQSQTQHTGQNSFVSAMMATVTNVLPSGVLQIEGNQGLTVNGNAQVLHVIGYVRPEDIDSTDQVLSSRIADVQATFSGNFQEGHKGLLRKILDFLF